MVKVAKWFWRKVVDLVSYLISPLVELYEMIQNEEIQKVIKNYKKVVDK